MWLCLTCVASSRNGVDHTTVSTTEERRTEVTEVEAVLTSMEKEIRMGKRRFRALWHELKTSGQEQEDSAEALNTTLNTLRTQTLKIRDVISRSIGSLNDFMACVNVCYLAHRTTDNGEPVPEANLRYFCNHNCMVAFEQRHAASTEPPDTSSDRPLASSGGTTPVGSVLGAAIVG